VADLILEIVEGGDAGRKVELADALELGRDPSAAIAIKDDQVSRRHARVFFEAGQATVEDLGSTNGTYVNDQLIASPRPLEPDDRIRVGATVLQLRTSQQVAYQPTAVRPTPDVTALGKGVLQPAAPEELEPSPVATPAPAPRLPTANEPAFVPPQLLEDAEAQSDYNAIARLVDTKVKRQTNIAVIALLGAAGLAVLLAFGLK
jgi:hypothetical protein